MSEKSEAVADLTNDDTLRPVEEVEVRGHIIDSLILPKVLDCITTAGGSFHIKKMTVGHDRTDPSYAAIDVRAADEPALQEILAQIADHGAVPTASSDCRLVEADIVGAFPDGFYSTTNQRSEVRVDGKWIPVAQQEMDCGITVDVSQMTAQCMPLSEVERGMPMVVGHMGVRVFPLERVEQDHSFAFMNSAVSTEKPKGVIIRQIARQLFENRGGGERPCWSAAQRSSTQAVAVLFASYSARDTSTSFLPATP